MKPLRQSLRGDLKWGVTWGLWFAGGYSILALGLYGLQGTLLGETSRFSLPLVILGYLAAGISGGSVVGLLRPVARGRVGATVLGAFIGVLVYFIAGITTLGARDLFTMPGLIATVVIGSVVGGACGQTSWTSGKKRI
jgi:hypothetical protein